MKFVFNVNIDDVARQVNRTVDQVRERVVQEVKQLSASTHAFVVARGQSELNGYMRKLWLGKDNRNIRWFQLSPSVNIWVVEIDPEAAKFEEDQPAQFMRWLLLNNKKAKRAKDGSMYAHIPIVQSRLAGSDPDRQSPKSIYQAIIKKNLQDKGISLKRIERNPDNSPKIGVLHKMNIEPPLSRTQAPGLYGTPRSQEIANRIGLNAYEGDYHLKGLAIVQRLNSKGKPVREAVTIRTISSKHEGEGLGRWTLKPHKGLKSIEHAMQYAQAEWANIVEMLKREFQ